MAARKRRVRRESPANVQLLERIRALKCDHPSWGYKRIAAWLRKREHLKANRKRVLRLMKADGLLVPKNLRLRATRRNSSTEKAKPKTIEPNRFRGTDMTRIMLPQSGWAYLHIVIDWGDKKLLAARLSRTSRSQDWITALEQAVASEFPMGIRDLPAGYDVPELVSDHGSQPTSTAFRGACEALGINQIFASYGNPKGNADTKRMMRTIKEDLIYSNDFQTFNELETALATRTKRYNEEFLHSTLGYESPIEYENWFYRATRREVPYLMS